MAHPFAVWPTLEVGPGRQRRQQLECTSFGANGAGRAQLVVLGLARQR